MTAETSTPPPEIDADTDAAQEQTAPACVMSFNASDPSGAGGIAGDVSTIAAMGAHALPVVTAVLLRDTAEIFEHSALDGDLVVEQAQRAGRRDHLGLEGRLPRFG